MTTVPTLPEYPQASDPVTFPTKAETFAAALPPWGVAVNAVGQKIQATASGLSAASARFIFSSSTADADPGPGFLRLDAATQNTATTIRADIVDVAGVSLAGLLDSMGAVGNPIKGHVRLFAATNPARWLLFALSAVASPSGYKNLTVSILASSAASPLVAGEEVILGFARAGEQGVQGPQGPQGPQGAPGVWTKVGGPVVVSSPVSSVDLASWLAEGYDYLFSIDGVLCSSGGQHLNIKVSTDGGATWHGGTDYEYSHISLNGPIQYNTGGASQPAFQVGQMPSNSSHPASLELVLLNPAQSVSAKILKWVYSVSFWPSYGLANFGSGSMWSSTSPINGIRFAASNGVSQIIGGTFNIYRRARA